MAHRQLNTNFRLNPWKGVKGSATAVFKAAAVSQELSPVLEYILQELYEAGYPAVKSSMFSLVNIYNPDTNTSVGFSERPHEDLVKPMTGLVLTFSMVSRPLIKTPPIVYQHGITDFTYFWGQKLTSATDNLVVSVPKEILKNNKVAWALTEEILTLYNLIGVVTKNFVMHEYNPKATSKFNVPNMPEGMMKSKYLEMSLPNLVKSTHPMYWPYSIDFWNKASQLLMPRHLTPKLDLYFCVYMFEILGPRLSPAASDYVYGTGPKTLSSFLMDGVRGLLQIVKSKNIPSRVEDSVYGTLHLLYALPVPGGIGETDDYAVVTSVLQGMLDRFEARPELEQEFIQMFSSISQAVKLLIKEDDGMRRFLEEVF